MSLTTIVGLDLALMASGVALEDGTFRTVRPPRAAKDYERHWSVVAELGAIIDEAGRPDLFVVEDYAPRGAGVNALIRTAEVGGMARAMLTRRAIPFALVKPNVLKMFATGKGNARKEAMADAANEAFDELENRDGGQAPPAVRPANFDEVDAYWLRRIGRAWYHSGGVTGVEHRDAAVLGVTWPELGA